jgi:hypothetical protein
MFCGISVAGQRFGQRFGGHDIAAGRQHLAAQARFQFIEVRIAAQHQAAGAHLAARRVQVTWAVLDTQHRALLEDAHAQAMGGTGFALDQVERVQVARAHVDQAAGVLVAGDDFVQLPGADQAGFMAVAQGGQVVLFVLEGRELRRGVGQFAEAPAQVAVDAVLAMRWPPAPPSRCRPASGSARRPGRRAGQSR